MKKVTYKIEQFKSITIEVETEEQEKQIEELNRDFERTDRQDRRIKAKTESLDQMYEETGNEPVDEGESPEELMMLKLEKEKVRNALNKIPRTETCFEWYLNFDLIDKPNEEKKMVWEFPIEFQEAKSYRTEVNSLLRPTQWQDLLVRVYV